jgi:hypothetical protein
VLICTAWGGNDDHANTSSKPASSALNAVNVVRLINTAENVEYRKSGKYLGWPELAKSPSFERAKVLFARSNMSVGDANISGEGPILIGWKLRMSVSADGKNYLLSLGPEENKSCDSSFFTNETGMIQEGRGLGCGGNEKK